jgi:hypothetical protein
MAKQENRNEKNRTGNTQKNGDGRNSQEDSFDGSFNSTEKDAGGYSRGSTEYEKHR